MIKTNEATRATDDGSWVGALGHIAAQARESEVGSRGGAALFAADDMVHLKAEMGILLMEQAVFTKPGRPLDDETAQAY
jgi:hypothetical protein